MKYRQLAQKLRWSRGPGLGDMVSERPRNRAGEFLDEDAPTMVEIGPDAPVNVEQLLRTGAIALPSEARAELVPSEGVADGEDE